jgi:hypothetical protein
MAWSSEAAAGSGVASVAKTVSTRAWLMPSAPRNAPKRSKANRIFAIKEPGAVPEVAALRSGSLKCRQNDRL